MTIQDIPNIKFITPSSRYYDCMLDFVVALCSWASYFGVYHGKAAVSFAPTLVNSKSQYPSIEVAGNVCGKSVSFVPHELFIDIVQNQTRNTRIPYSEIPAISQLTGVTVDSAQLIEGFATAMFIRYYEDSKSNIEAKYSTDPDKWPEILRFARVIRNCMSHGGKIRIDNVKSRPVTYFGLTYSCADNGKKVLHDPITPADIFYLMLDMDLEF